MAQSTFPKPVDQEIKDLNGKIGDVPSGQTVEGQITALNSKITPVSKDKKFTRSSATTHTFTIPSQSSNILILSGNGGSRQFVAYIFRASGNSTVWVIYSSQEVTWAESQGTLTITFESAGAIDGRCVNAKGDPIT